MKKLCGFLGATIGSTVGWYAAAKFGFMAAFIASSIGGGVGLYYAVKWARQYEG